MAVDGTKWQLDLLQKIKLEQLKDDMRLFVDCNTIRIQLSGFELILVEAREYVKLRKNAKQLDVVEIDKFSLE